MASRELRYVITGDARDFAKTLRSVDGRLKDSETRAKRFGDSVKGAIGVGAITSVGLFGKKMLDAANEAEVSTKRMKAQLDALGISYGDNAKRIDDVIQRTSRLAALDDEELQDSFTNIVRVTGDVNKSLKLVGLAADFARGKNIDVAKAGEIVGKVAGGNTGILSRYGFQIEKGATATEALGEMQKRFGGQAKAYGESNKGAGEQAQVAWENLKETLGTELAPAVRDVAKATSKFLEGMQDGTGAGGDFVRALEDIRDAIAPVAKFLKDHPKLIAIAVGAWATYKTASLIALGAIKVKTFRQAFMKSVPAAATAGTAAGTAMAASTTTAASAGMVKGKGKFRGAALAIGKFMGPLIAIPLAIEIAQAIERKFNPGGITATDLGNESKQNVGNIIDNLKNPPSIGPGGAGLSKPGSGLGGLPKAGASRLPGGDPGGGAGSVRSRRRRRGGANKIMVLNPNAGGGGIVALGRWMQSKGYNVGEHPAFGGVAPVHVPGSAHYSGNALDVNADSFPGGEMAALDALASELRGAGWSVLWRVADHFDHLHVQGSGSVPGSSASGQFVQGFTAGGGSGGSGGGGFARRPGLSPAQRQAKKAFGAAQRGAHRSAGRAVRHEQTMLRRRRAWPRQQHESTLALAELTESPLDDIQELSRWEGVLEGRLKKARSAGKTGQVTEIAQELHSVREAIAGLKEATEDNTQALIDAENARAEALRELTAEVKRGNDLTERIANTEAPVLKQALADAVSGSIGGRVLRGLGTPAFAGGGMTY